MKKTTVLTIVLLVALPLGGWLYVANPFSSDMRMVRELSQAFMEDLQYKDFRSSSLYHHLLERDRVDIGRSLERLFMIKPEFLDIREFRITRADIDSSGDRARVHVNTRFRRLNMNEDVEEGDVILYWIKRHPDCPLGGSCSADGRCLDEAELAIKKKEEKKNQQRSRAEKELSDPTDLEETGEYYSCNPESEHRWYMNLDSTLKERGYNH